MRHEFNSNQIMALVNQMKSASVTKSDVDLNSGTFDEETMAALLKRNNVSTFDVKTKGIYRTNEVVSRLL
jgi:hypothetical protein